MPEKPQSIEEALQSAVDQVRSKAAQTGEENFQNAIQTGFKGSFEAASQVHPSKRESSERLLTTLEFLETKKQERKQEEPDPRIPEHLGIQGANPWYVKDGSE